MMMNIVGVAAGIVIGLTTIYPNAGTVVDVDYEKNVVTVNDFGGEVWQFEGTEDWLGGDIVAFMVSDNGTPEYIHDDIIVDDTVRYLGY